MSTTLPHLSAAGVIWRSQLSRIKVARGPLLIVASMQSIGLLILLRGIVDDGRSTKEQVVAGASVLVLAYVALNLLAQRFGNLKGSGGLGYYAALPVSGVSVVLGTAAAYAGFTVPGAVLTGVIGCLLYGLPLWHLWALIPVIALGGAALAGLGACIGLIAPRAELATMLGQLGMSGVLFLGLIPEARMPGWMDPVLSVVPSTYAVRALADALDTHFDGGRFLLDLTVCAAVAVAALALAAKVYDRVVRR